MGYSAYLINLDLFQDGWGPEINNFVFYLHPLYFLEGLIYYKIIKGIKQEDLRMMPIPVVVMKIRQM